MCDGCRQNKPTVSAIIDGKFGQYCMDCRNRVTRQAAPGSAQYSRQRDRDAHEADLVQPWDAKGNPNKEFIRLYPEEAKLNFTEEEIEKYNW